MYSLWGRMLQVASGDCVTLIVKRTFPVKTVSLSRNFPDRFSKYIIGGLFGLPTLRIPNGLRTSLYMIVSEPFKMLFDYIPIVSLEYNYVQISIANIHAVTNIVNKTYNISCDVFAQLDDKKMGVSESHSPFHKLPRHQDRVCSSKAANRPCSGRIDIFNTLAFAYRSIPILPKTGSI